MAQWKASWDVILLHNLQLSDERFLLVIAVVKKRKLIYEHDDEHGSFDYEKLRRSVKTFFTRKRKIQLLLIVCHLTFPCRASERTR